MKIYVTSSALRVKSCASLQTISSDVGAGCDSNSIWIRYVHIIGENGIGYWDSNNLLFSIADHTYRYLRSSNFTLVKVITLDFFALVLQQKCKLVHVFFIALYSYSSWNYCQEKKQSRIIITLHEEIEKSQLLLSKYWKLWHFDSTKFVFLFGVNSSSIFISAINFI